MIFFALLLMLLRNYEYNTLKSKEQRKITLMNAIQYHGYKTVLKELLKLKTKNSMHDIKDLLYPYEFTRTQQGEIYCDELMLFIA
jgi:hypothetical protein